MPEKSEYFQFMEGIVEAWTGRLKQARESKQAFTDIAEQCYSFYCKPSGFMWEPKFKSKFLPRVDAPQFSITIMKAFEFVAIYGPMLFWKYPNRHVVTEEPLELSDELMSDPETILRLGGFDGQFMEMGEEFVTQVRDSILAERQMEVAKSSARNQMMQKYLNYSQREQPYGGLAFAGEMAITESLVKGRGCLWPEVYSFAGDDRQLTGLFYDSVDNFFIDPDCEDPQLESAYWVARKHVDPVDVVSARFPDVDIEVIRGAASHETANSQGAKQTDVDRSNRKNGKTFDLVTWYEIWSRGGVGQRMSGVETPLHDAFDDVVGDNAYICIAPGVPYPLNATRDRLANSTDDEVASLFEWPTYPYWKDSRYPVALLDYYRDPNGPWPIAPLATGLGELICLNILVSAFIEQAYDNRKSIIAYLSSAKANVEQALKSNNSPCFVEINDNVQKSITDMIQYLQRPEMNKDLLGAIEYVSQLFDKRTGLSEIMYAMNTGGTQSRTAADVQEKSERASIRPDKMAKDVALWMGEAATLEMLAASWNIVGQDVAPLMGKHGAKLWDILITEEDPAIVAREMRCKVEANDLRKPNKARESENLQSIMQWILPELGKQADVTGDTEPLNNFFQALGGAIEQDMSKLRLPPRTPSPEAMEAQQAMQQLEQQKLETEVQLKQADIEIKQMEMEIKRIDGEVAMATGGAEVQKMSAELEFQQAENVQALQFDQTKNELDAEQQHAKNLLDIMHRRAENIQKLRQMEAEGQLRIQQSRQMAKAKPKSAKT